MLIDEWADYPYNTFCCGQLSSNFFFWSTIMGSRMSRGGTMFIMLYDMVGRTLHDTVISYMVVKIVVRKIGWYYFITTKYESDSLMDFCEEDVIKKYRKNMFCL